MKWANVWNWNSNRLIWIHVHNRNLNIVSKISYRRIGEFTIAVNSQLPKHFQKNSLLKKVILEFHFLIDEIYRVTSGYAFSTNVPNQNFLEWRNRETKDETLLGMRAHIPRVYHFSQLWIGELFIFLFRGRQIQAHDCGETTRWIRHICMICMDLGALEC